MGKRAFDAYVGVLAGEAMGLLRRVAARDPEDQENRCCWFCGGLGCYELETCWVDADGDETDDMLPYALGYEIMPHSPECEWMAAVALVHGEAYTRGTFHAFIVEEN